jgi:hypothetical protein
VKYRNIHNEEFEAIKFNYTTSGIADLLQFARDNIHSYGTERNLNAIPWVKIMNYNTVTHTANIGDWIIKDKHDNVFACSDKMFSVQYTHVNNLVIGDNNETAIKSN